LTYAGTENQRAWGDRRHVFVQGDIGDRELVRGLLKQYKPWAIINFAAESHVDRSIHGPDDFIQTNMVGTFHLLQEARAYWEGLPPEARERFRFLHVSTDEVRSLKSDDLRHYRGHTYARTASTGLRAASDHLVRLSSHLRAASALHQLL
jgi:dTDP-glucose 4,6-dehydratase